MKKTLALLAIVSLTGCFTVVRGEGLPDERSSDPAPAPASSSSSSSSTSSSSVKMPSSTSGDASAAPVASCRGWSTMCHELDVGSCREQKGCFVSLDGETCTGAATSCSMLNTDAACEDQLGCTWESSSEPSPPR